jgi:hypothetical protein
VEEEIKKLSNRRPKILESLARGLSELSMTDFSKQEAEDHDRLVRRLVQLYVQECPLAHLVTAPRYRADLDINDAEEAPALHLIKLCYKIAQGDLRAIRIVLNRALEIHSKIDADYLFDQLSPFIKSLRSYLQKQTPPQDLSVQPYFGFVNTVVSALEDFLKDFLKKKPAGYEDLQTQIRMCPSHGNINEFITSPDQNGPSLSKTEKDRIKQELPQLFSGGWLRWDKGEVKKTVRLIKAHRWGKSMKSAKNLWEGIGPKDVLRRILGDKHSEMDALLQETTPIVSDFTGGPSEPRTYPSPSVRPAPAATCGGSAASAPMKRSRSRDTTQANQTPHKKQRSEEKVIER